MCFVHESIVLQEFSKLRQDNNYLRSKLRKAEQELEDIKSLNITIRDERDRLKKKVYHLDSVHIIAKQYLQNSFII